MHGWKGVKALGWLQQLFFFLATFPPSCLSFESNLCFLLKPFDDDPLTLCTSRPTGTEAPPLCALSLRHGVQVGQ